KFLKNRTQSTESGSFESRSQGCIKPNQTSCECTSVKGTAHSNCTLRGQSKVKQAASLAITYITHATAHAKKRKLLVCRPLRAC
ncbi:AGAP012128-PA, partial [Anopheles gambiae str. PEST]